MSGVVTPVLAAVSVSQGNIVVNWMPIQGSSYFKATVFLGANPVAGASNTDQGFGTMITPNPVLAANQTYQVMVAQCDASGNQTSPYSQPFFLLQNPVSVLTAFVNANNTVLVSWTPPAVGNPAGGIVSLVQTGVSAELASVQVNGNSVVLQPDAPLLLTNSYQLHVSPFNSSGGSTGPDNSITLLLQPSVVDAVNYSVDTGQVQADGTPPSPLPPNLYLYISLYINGVFAGMNTDSVPTSASISLLASALNYANLYTITLRNGMNGAYGPETLPSTVIIAAPVLQQINFTGPTVEVSWKNLPACYLVTGGRIGLIGDGQGLNSNDVLGDSGPVTVPTTPRCSNYQVQVYPAFGNSRGPRTTPVTMPAVAPVISASSFNGNNVVISWGAVANTAGYKCTVSDSFGRIVATAETSGTTAAIEVQLEPGIIYQATVWAYAKTGGLTISGPVSLPGTVISAYPALTSVNYNGAKLTVSWNAAAIKAATGITGYQVGLYLNGQLQGSLTDVSGITTGTADITVNLSAWLEYTVAVRAICSGCQGPFSQQSAVITASAVPANVVYNGTQINMSWTFPPKDTVTGYLVTLFKDGLAQPVTGKNYAANPGWIFDTPLGAGVWTAAVQAISAMAQGPVSGSLNVINDAVELLSATYDGQLLKITRAANSASYITGYNFLLLEGGKILRSAGTTELFVVMDALLAPYGDYTIQLQPAGINSLGKTSTALTLITTPPALSSAGYDKTALTVNWAAVTGATGYTLQLLEDGLPLTITPVYTATQATVTITLSPYKNYQVQVMANAGSVSGPFSELLEIIPGNVTINALVYDQEMATVRWDRLTKYPDVTYLVTLFKDGVAQPLTNGNYTSAGELTFNGALAATNVWTATVQAIKGIVTGPVSDTATFITETISPITVNYSDAVLTASWNKAVAGTVNGYIFSVLLNGEKLESVFTNALTAAINYKLNPANSYTCQVQAASAGVTGPGLQTSDLQVIAPVIKSILYQQGTLTVSWDALAGINTYQLSLYCDHVAVAITPQYNGPAATATVALDKTKNYTVKVNAVNGILSGPQSPAEAIINVAPSIGCFHYDGAKLEIEWKAVQQATVNGYLLELSGSASEKISLNVAFNKAIIPVVFLDTQTYTLKICAVGNITAGPFSDTLNPYVIDPGYYFGAAAPAAQPWISRSAIRPVSPAAFSLYLPQLFNTPPDPLPAGLAPGGTSPFQMSLTANTTLPYMLSVALTSDTWQFGNQPVRNSLQLDYLAFIAALEGVAGGLIPGTIPFLQQLIARSLPLTFDETIYYAAGFYPAQRYVNLQAGMRLSLSYGSYQFTGPVQANEPAALLNGFTGNGTASYVLGSYLSGPTPGSQVLDLGFSNFLSSVIQNVDANTGGGANIVDLYNSAFRQPYFRLIYPQNFASADTKGWADSTKNVSVLSAASYTTLEQATGIILNGGTLPDGAYLTFFRGRVSMIPEIQVFLNGRAKWIAVGTTIRNLLEEVWGNLPRAAAGNPGRGIKTVQLMRIADNIINDVNDVSALSQLGRRNQVYISYQSITTYANGKDDFDLPLIQGDALITDKTAF